MRMKLSECKSLECKFYHCCNGPAISIGVTAYKPPTGLECEAKGEDTQVQTFHDWAKDNKKSWKFWLVTGLGSGMLRPAPGTWGSIAGLLLAYFMVHLGTDPIELVFWCLGLTIIGTKAIDFVHMETGIKDASEIVVDEVIGQWIALLPVVALAPTNLAAWLAAFILFRVFDIIKPWPIYVIDRNTQSGLGVILDDVVAGFIAAILLYLALVYTNFPVVQI